MNKEIIILPVEKLIPEVKPDLVAQKTPEEEAELTNTSDFNRTGNSFDNTHLAGIMEIIKNKNSKREIEPLITEIRKRLKDQTIIDLGAGSTNLGYITSLIFGASKYIAVEKFESIANKLNVELRKIKIKDGSISLENLSLYDGREILKEEYGLETKELIPASVVQDKMLRFLNRIPDNSVSILTSGITYALIDDTEYRDNVAKEIERVLDPKGLYVSIHSDIKTKNLFKIPELSNEKIGIKVFAK